MIRTSLWGVAAVALVILGGIVRQMVREWMRRATWRVVLRDAPPGTILIDADAGTSLLLVRSMERASVDGADEVWTDEAG